MNNKEASVCSTTNMKLVKSTCLTCRHVDTGIRIDIVVALYFGRIDVWKWHVRLHEHVSQRQCRAAMLVRLCQVVPTSSLRCSALSLSNLSIYSAEVVLELIAVLRFCNRKREGCGVSDVSGSVLLPDL